MGVLITLLYTYWSGKRKKKKTVIIETKFLYRISYGTVLMIWDGHVEQFEVSDCMHGNSAMYSFHANICVCS